MKIFTFNSKTLSKLIVLPALVLIAITNNSCKKETNTMSATGSPKASLSDESNSSIDSEKLNASVAKVLKDFVISGSVTTNTQSGSGSGSSTYSNVSVNVTVTSTPATNIYSWSNPSTGTYYTLTQSTSSGSGSAGGGLGQLSYDGKSFDFNYVLCIQAGSTDPTWNGFLGGRDLRGVIAINGNIADKDFALKSMAIFLVNAKGGDGKYDFVSWNTSSIKSGDAVGEILDFSAIPNGSLANMALAKILFTSNGSIEVADKTFTLSSNAKATDLITNTEYPISGNISCE